jgi:hypothetical protein
MPKQSPQFKSLVCPIVPLDGKNGLKNPTTLRVPDMAETFVQAAWSGEKVD